MPFIKFKINSAWNFARSPGILRGREFMMKDMYSFHTSQEDFEDFYDKMKNVYKTIFPKSWHRAFTYLTFASAELSPNIRMNFKRLPRPAKTLFM